MRGWVGATATGSSGQPYLVLLMRHPDQGLLPGGSRLLGSAVRSTQGLPCLQHALCESIRTAALYLGSHG